MVLEEGDDEVFDAFAFDLDHRVFPIPEPLFVIRVFIREVHAARIGDLVVDDDDLAVVPVIDEIREDRGDRMERIGFDARFLHLMGEVIRDRAIAADVIKDDPDIDPFGSFLLKDIDGLLVPFAFRNDEEL